MGSAIRTLMIGALCVGVVLQLLVASCFFIDGELAARLVLWGVLTEEWGLQTLSAVRALLRLRQAPTPRIELQGARITDDAALELAALLVRHGKVSQTQSLALLRTALSPVGVEGLCDLVVAPGSALRELDLSHNAHLGDASAGVLERFLAGSEAAPAALRTLRLADCGLSTAGVRLLTRGAETSVLQTLDLSMNFLTGAGEALAELLLAAPLLRELRLVDAGFGDVEAAALAPALAASEVEWLDLAFNALTSVGAGSLAEHLAESRLQHLCLACNRLDAGEHLGKLIAAWAAAPRVSLDFSGNALSVEEMRAAEALCASLRVAD